MFLSPPFFPQLVLDSAGKLGKMLVGMNKALGEIPLTVKLRTGIKDGKNTVHKLMPRLSAEFGASCITVRCYASPLLFFSFLGKKTVITHVLSSYMAGLANNGIPSWPIGITSKRALSKCVPVRKRRTVSILVLFLLSCNGSVTAF
jgi:hypothetical protein